MFNSFKDKQLDCKDCSAPFTWTAGEQQFYAEKGFSNAPTRCTGCRMQAKSVRQQGGDRPSFPITCNACGKKSTVPFEPRKDRPVLCRDCFKK